MGSGCFRSGGGGSLKLQGGKDGGLKTLEKNQLESKLSKIFSLSMEWEENKKEEVWVSFQLWEEEASFVNAPGFVW